MSSLANKDKQQKLQEKYQAMLSAMLREEDNKYCVDCDSKGPRWASWNLGIFLCIRCAGIHRNLGVHISRVKSVNLDQWTAEQIASMQAMGNSKARAVYEANLPDNFRRSQNDSAMEQFIRGKYEARKWILKDWTPQSITSLSTELNDNDAPKQLQKQSASSSTNNNTSTKIKIEPKLPKPLLNSTGLVNINQLNNSAKNNVKLEEKKETVLLDFDTITNDTVTSSTTTATVTTQNQLAEEVDFFKSSKAPSVFENFEDFFIDQNASSAPVVQPISPLNSNDTTNNHDLDQINILMTTTSAPSVSDKTKIDKNSILALYNNQATTTSNNAFPSSQNNQLFQINQQTQPQQQQQQQHFLQNVNNNNLNMPYQYQQQMIGLNKSDQTVPKMFSNNSNMNFNNNNFQQSSQVNNLKIQMDQLSFFDKSAGAAKLNQTNNSLFSQNLMFAPNAANYNNNNKITNNNDIQSSNNFFDSLIKPISTVAPSGATNHTDLFPNIGNTLSSDLWQ